MSIKTIIIPFLVFMASSCAALTSEGRRLKDILRLTDFSGPTNRCTWVSPSQVSVSNQIFRIEGCRQNGNLFDAKLARHDGGVVGSCMIMVAESADEALDAICDRKMQGCAASVEAVASACHVERDISGNVLVFRVGRGADGDGIERDRLLFYRTYGNLYVRVAINTEKTTFGAWDFALPLIQAGVQNP